MKLSEVAGDLDVTFHKAIDETPDPVKSMQLLSETGITRVLTSGGKKTAREGAEIINQMQHSADHIKVIAAGKITSSNLIELSKLIHTDEFHGKKIVGDLYSV
jgi:copper homeostasis protein